MSRSCFVSTRAFGKFLLFVMTCSSVLYLLLHYTRALAESYIVVCCLFVLIPLDLNNVRQLNERNWPLIVVFLDVALVLDMRKRVPYIVLAGLIPYLWLVQINASYHFGLTRDPVVGYEMPAICDCARPPCEYSPMHSLMGGLSHVAALVLDFYFTRRFAVKLGREEADFGGQLMSSKYVYELLPRSSGEAIETASPRQGAEWMYELVDNASHAWDTHDACVRAFLAGASIEQALQGCSDDDAEVIRVQLTSACASREPCEYLKILVLHSGTRIVAFAFAFLILRCRLLRARQAELSTSWIVHSLTGSVKWVFFFRHCTPFST